MMRVAICDTDAPERARLHAMLNRCPASLEISEYADAEALMWDVETGKAHFDLYLLDICLPDLDGLEAARRIRGMDSEAALVFFSSSEEFYREAFEVYALNYFLKPVEQETLDVMVAYASKRLQERQERTLTINYRGHTHVLRYENIEYISSSNHTLLFRLHNGEERRCYDKLDKVDAQLDHDVFVRCHQSHIINLRYVRDRIPNGFRMTNTVIPISRTYTVTAQKALNRYLLGIFERP